MRPPETEDITALLIEVNEERPGAWDKLIAAAYDELRAGAKNFQRGICLYLWPPTLLPVACIFRISVM